MDNRKLALRLAYHLDQVRELFGPAAKVTLMVRSEPDTPTEEGVMMSDDTIPELRALLDRREADLKLGINETPLPPRLILRIGVPPKSEP